MPGRRNLAHERARHAADYPARLAAIHGQLVSQLPQLDQALVGWPAILAQLDRCGVRRQNGGPISVRMVQRWRRVAICPVLPGHMTLGFCCTPPLSTSFALTAWVLAQLSTDEQTIRFRVDLAGLYGPEGKAPSESGIACRKRRGPPRRLAA